MILAITGGRNNNDWRAIWRALSRQHLSDAITLLVHGACQTGADLWARRWADFYQAPHTGQRYAADWATHGPKAGPLRNLAMLREESPGLLLAFHGGRGTNGCVELARKLGIPAKVQPQTQKTPPDRSLTG